MGTLASGAAEGTLSGSKRFAITPKAPAHPDRLVEGAASTVEFVIGDLVTQDTGAIVNPTTPSLSGGGMVDLAIQRAAGPALGDACRVAIRKLPALLSPGEAVITAGFALRAGYVVHCVPPRYGDNPAVAAAQLASCFRNAIVLARNRGVSSIAFPSIATGILGYPLNEAAPIALSAVVEEVTQYIAPFEVRFVLFGPSTLDAYVAAAEAYFAGPRPSRRARSE